MSAPAGPREAERRPGAQSGPGLGLPRLHLRVTDSTNTRARELAAAGAPHGTLVTAAEQSAGRGRQGRTWSAPAGRALLCSLVLRDPPRLLPLAAGVAVAQVVDLAGVRSQLKWPNDVLIGAGKAAGVLVEGRPQEHWAVLGIGINVAVRMDDLPVELRGQAATLGLEPEDIESILATLLDAVSQWLGADEAEVLSAVRERDALRGAPVRWAEGEGVGSGIDADGRLVVAVSDGRQVALDAGEIHLIR